RFFVYLLRFQWVHRGRGGLSAMLRLQHRKSMAMSAAAEWNPKARRATIRSLLFAPSARPLVRRSSRYATMPSKWRRIVRAAPTNAGKRERLAQDSHPRSTLVAFAGLSMSR